jgi:hypothetical protein
MMQSETFDKSIHNILYFVALVSERTIPTERPQLVGEVVSTFAGWRVSRGQRNGFPRSLISVFLTGSATFSSK